MTLNNNISQKNYTEQKDNEQRHRDKNDNRQNDTESNIGEKNDNKQKDRRM